MTKLERWFLKRLLRREVRQGNHKQRIVRLYVLIAEACKDEFTEDNKPTLDAFLTDCQDLARQEYYWNRFQRKTGMI